MLAVECDSDICAEAGVALEHRRYIVTVAHVFAYQRSALGGEIAEMDAALAEYGDGVLIGRVFGFRAQLDRIAGGAQRDLETAARTLALVGVIGADDGEG